MILRKMGIDEETFESFLLNIYEPCQRAGLTPDKIGPYLEDLFKFSKEEDANNNNNDGNPIKLSEIPYYIQQMKNEKRTLEQDIQNLRKEKKQSQEEASYAKELRDAAIEDERILLLNSENIRI